MSQSMPSGILQPKQLSNHIAERIRADILGGVRHPGEFLRLDEVAQQLGVSVTPVREALMGLSVEGFVRHAERRGFIVSALKRGDLEDLYTLLAEVSGRLTERAASAATPHDLEQLEIVHNRMIRAAELEDFENVERANDEFHRIINRAADSAKLAWILLSILKYVPTRFYANITGLTNMLIEQHGNILEAIKGQDPKAAYEAMYEHEKLAMREVIENLERRGIFELEPQE
ncbi:GntR family transcriptional regulator [Paeniglutamicibacter sp. ABSL32-1]|uniref:GntR family transcriptional regulator n=1 Tax=Paeniglutamicibacter quisquiliarum TaxID=2849498 RepID=UPI001C2CD13C|nr:GntR family transcriptional regulator [Paeniglutamicibacter quisquiliarum]